MGTMNAGIFRRSEPHNITQKKPSCWRTGRL